MKGDTGGRPNAVFWAALLSIGTHLAVGWWVWHLAPERNSLPVVLPNPLEVTLVEFPAAAQRAPAEREVAGNLTVKRARTSRIKALVHGEPASSPPQHENASAAAPLRHPDSAELPTRLLPSANVFGGANGGDSPGEQFPADTASESVPRLREDVRVQKTVQSLLRGAVGAARMRGGLPPPRVQAMAQDLKTRVAEAPPFGAKTALEVAKSVGRKYLTDARSYAQKGSPFADSPEFLNPDTAGRLGQTASWTTDTIVALQSMGATERVKDHLFKARVVAIAQLVEGEGPPAVSLLTPSGDAGFDMWAQEQLIGSARATPLPASVLDGGALSMRTIWAIRGTRSFVRSVRDASRFGHSVAMPAATAILSGSFDVAGELDYVDFCHPKYEGSAELLLVD